MVWTDGSDKAFKLTPRVNHTLTAVPPKRGGGEPSDMPTAGRLYLFGGDDGHTTRNDLWVYDVERQEWDEPELRGRRPSARSRHTATFVRWFRDDTQVDEDRIYVYGGVGASTEVVHYVDIARRTWVEPRTVGERPLPLLGHTAVHLNGSLWVFGGRDARRNYNGLWRLDTISHEWLRPAPTGMLPPPASKHVMCTAGANRLLVALGELPPGTVYRIRGRDR